MKPVLLAVFVFVQAVALLTAGLATLWWSSDLMTWLIYQVGEEYALGANNVIRTENGGVLLTNPLGMILWTLPFWFLGLLHITAALTLTWLGAVRLSPRCSGPPPRQVAGNG